MAAAGTTASLWQQFVFHTTADTDDHIVHVCEGHDQIQKLKNQGARLTLRSYHTTAKIYGCKSMLESNLKLFILLWFI